MQGEIAYVSDRASLPAVNEAAPTRPRLRRALGLRTVVSTSTGLAYAAISFLGCVLVASYLPGDGAWLAIALAGALSVLAAACFADLNARYPSAAAIRLYIQRAFNERAALIISFAYLMTVVTVIAADSFVVGSAVSYALSDTAFSGIPTLLWILGLLALATIANLRGIRPAGVLQDITTYSLLLSAAVVSLIALRDVGTAPLRSPWSGFDDVRGLFNAAAAGVFVFSAFEWVTPLAEEVEDGRLIPRGMYVSLALLTVAYGLFTLAVTHRLSVPDANHPGQWILPANIAGSSMHVMPSAYPQMLMAEAALGNVGRWWMLSATLLTGVMTFNGGFVAASRFLYAAARDHTLPQRFARLNRFLVPSAAIITLSVASAVVAVIVFLNGQFQLLILVGAALEAMIYAVSGLCVLRVRQGERPVIPALTVLVFGALFVGALTQGGPGVPAWEVIATVAGTFLVSAIYVVTCVPTMKAAAERTRLARRRRPTSPLD